MPNLTERLKYINQAIENKTSLFSELNLMEGQQGNLQIQSFLSRQRKIQEPFDNKTKDPTNSLKIQTIDDVLPIDKIKAQKICIVANDICLDEPRGGVGKALHSLALTLVAAGFEVTMLYLAPERYSNTIQIDASKTKKYGYKIEIPPITKFLNGASWSRRASYDAYQWLKLNNFDWIHFHEWLGIPYYSLIAKKAKIAFNETKICLGVHGPHEWILEGNSEIPSNPDLIEITYMEQQCIELAPILWSPSKYLLEWLKNKNFTFESEQVFSLPYLSLEKILPNPLKQEAKTIAIGEITEIVYFGRIEKRKGIKLLLDAWEILLTNNISANKIQLTLIGPAGPIEGINGYNYAINRGKNWELKPKILSAMNNSDLMEYLKQSGRAVVIPSITDNSPLAIYECLSNKIPFITSKVGGIPEIIDETCHHKILFKPTPQDLANYLLKLIDYPENCIGKFKNQPDYVRQQWIQFHGQNFQQKSPSQITTEISNKHEISLCITHYERPQQLERALKSALSQTHLPKEIIIVDDGSSSSESIAMLASIDKQEFIIPVRIIRNAHHSVTFSRNIAACHATGEYLVFLDDDNIMRSDALKTLLDSALTLNSDIVSCSYLTFKSNQNLTDFIEQYLPLGNSLSNGALWNCFGDTFSLQKRSVYLKIGGQEIDEHAAFEDWQYYAEAAFHGVKIAAIPEQLCWNEISTPRLTNATPYYANMQRSLLPYLKRAPKWQHQYFELIRGAREKNKICDETLSINQPELGRFYVNTESLFDLKKHPQVSEIKELHKTKITVQGSSLHVYSDDNDPAFLLPEFKLPNSGIAQLSFSMISNQATEFKVYYKDKESIHFSEDRTKVLGISIGLNQRLTEINCDELTDRLRIDPGAVSGEYIFLELELRIKINNQEAVASTNSLW